MKRFTPRLVALLGAGMLSMGAHAAPITFDFTFSAAALPPDRPAGGTFPDYRGFSAPVVRAAAVATATGSITFESTLLANPGENDFILPNPAVLALTVKVSNAASGNGSFTIADFNEVYFKTNGGTLNFNQQLVGQPTQGDTWGTPSSGAGGDFNFFIPMVGAKSSAVASPPSGVFWFTIAADGGNEDSMQLASMAIAAPAATATSVPTLSAWMLAALAGLLALATTVFLNGIRSR